MKNGSMLLFAFLFMFGFAALAFAAQDAVAPAAQPAPSSNGGFGGITFTTYAGIAAGVWAVVGVLKNFWKEKLKDKEPLIAMGLAIVIGVVAKLLGAFEGPKTGADSWVQHVVALVGAGIGSGLLYDKLGAVMKPSATK